MKILDQCEFLRLCFSLMIGLDSFLSILSTYDQTLCDSFHAARWDEVAHYKSPYKLGPIVGYRLKHSSDLPPGGTDVDRWEISRCFDLGRYLVL